MHNVETAREYHDRTQGYAAPGSSGGSWDNNKVLTIRHAWTSQPRELNLLVRDGDYNPGLTLDPWGEPFRIEGEDLFALRELLLAMPEAAFVRPQPSRVDFEVGDKVWVDDPVFGRKTGEVTTIATDGTLGIEGPRVDESRRFWWKIDATEARRVTHRSA